MEEFIKPVEPSNSSEELLSKEDRQTLRNERLLEACSRDDTERALQLLDEGADCCTEDDKQWTPLQWAATNGNMPLVRKLLAGGAANMYYSPQYGPPVVEDDPEASSLEDSLDSLKSRLPNGGQQRPKKYTPLHWAAFKGHLKIVWLLLKAGLSPHVKDVLGNTVLHQAAAGGDVATVKTILSLGVDVDAKNGRGHTALALASTEGSKLILEAASTATQCKDSGEHFSYKVMRYMCSFSEGFFARKAVKMFWVYNTAEDDERECPVTWSAETIRLNKQAEDRIHQALESGSLDEIDAALMLTADHPVCPKLQKRISQEKSKLEGKIALSEAMDVRALVTDDDFYSAIDRLKAAIQIAVEKNCDEAVLNAAQRELKKLEIELRITKLVKKPSYDAFTPNSKFLNALDEAIETAREASANPVLLNNAIETRQRTLDYMTLEKRIESVETVCAIPAFFDLKSDAKSQLPDWAKESEPFEEIVLQFREEIAAAKESGVATALISIAENEKLSKLETLLIELKRIEEEQRMKKATKKKKAPKKKPAKK